MPISDTIDYYPFGMQMPGRVMSSGSYRYGFQGQEKDDEIEGSGNVTDIGDRHLLTRIGRTAKNDKRSAAFPSESPYIFAGNNPINLTDVNGEFKWPGDEKQQKAYEVKYPMFTKYLKENITEITKSEAIMTAFQEFGMLSANQVEKDIKYGDGPVIVLGTRTTGVDKESTARIYGQYDGINSDGEQQIFLDEGMIQKFEDSFDDPKISDNTKQAMLLGIISTLFHEETHKGAGDENYVNDGTENGFEFEKYVYGRIYPPTDIWQGIQVLRLKMTGDNIEMPSQKIVGTAPKDKDPTVIPTLPKKE